MSFELSLIINIFIMAVFCFFLVEKKHFKNTKPFVFIAIGIYVLYYIFFCLLRG